MLTIEFAMSFPSTGYFVSCMMMIEFTTIGQVIPTRMDVMPYKLGPFAEFQRDPNKTIDPLKFVLVLYTFYCVFGNFMRKRKNRFSFQTFSENATDITIVLL